MGFSSSPLLAISRPLSRAQLHMLLLLCMIHLIVLNPEP
jgi:hypothetical protein